MKNVIIPDDYDEQIKAVRAKLKLSQEKFGFLIGSSFTSVARWESRKTTPAISAWSKIETLIEEQAAK